MGATGLKSTTNHINLVDPQKLRNVFGSVNRHIIEGGLSDEDSLALSDLVQSLKGNNLQIAEIGSWRGCSTSILASEVVNRGGTVFAIDHWKGNEGTNSALIASRYNIYFLFKENMRVLGVWDVIRPMRMSSQKAVLHFEDASLDLVFLDGDHRYQCIKQDILSWLPKIKPGGILCGHDAETYYSKWGEKEHKLINEHLDDDSIRVPDFYIEPSPIIHCGVIKALHDCLNDKHSLLADRIWYYKI